MESHTKRIAGVYMAKFLLVLLFIPIVAFADSFSGVSLSGVRSTTISGGSGIAGVEAACTTSGLYGSGGNCICSEMLNESIVDAGLGIPDSLDPPASPDTHECWGRFTSPAPTLGIESGRVASTADVSALAGWGTVNYALEQTNQFIWAMAPYNPITSSTRTLCVKYFRQHNNPWSDDAGCRTKGIQMNFNDRLAIAQFTTQSDGGSCSTTPKPYWLQMSDIAVGLSSETFLTTVKSDECDDKPCKLEMCVDGNILAGTSLQVRARVTSYEGAGEVSSVASSVWSPGGGPSNHDFFGGDWWHSGGGSEIMLSGMFSVWAWDSDTDQWPPNTTEIE